MHRAVATTVLAALLLGGPPAPTLLGGGDAAPVVAVSPDPVITIVGSGSARHDVVEEAVARFVELGMLLPDLQIHFFEEPESCGGEIGRFEANETPWKISVCSDLGFVLVHELAHAWERANVTKAQRRAFVAARNVASWNDSGDEWADRGVEQAAFVIQQNLLDGEVRSVSAEWADRFAAFEILTGVASPRRATPAG